MGAAAVNEKIDLFRRDISMKRLVSLLLSLLICLSLLTNQAKAIDSPESNTSPDQVEVLGLDDSDKSDGPGIMFLGGGALPGNGMMQGMSTSDSVFIRKLPCLNILAFLS